MLVITDIAPTQPNCPDTAALWSRWKPAGIHQRVAERCFREGRQLYAADDDGRKMAKEFPVVIWREHTDESQIELASKLADWLPADTHAVVLVSAASGDFRGHYDRRWHSGEGNLHVTVLLRETAPHEHVGLAYAILPVLALCDCAAGLVTSHRTVKVKWINDILLDGAKIGGALSRGKTRGSIFTHAVFGMGLNINTIPPVPRTVFVPSVTCLKPHTKEMAMLDVLKRLLSAFASNHSLLIRKGLSGLVPRYRAVSDVIGRNVRLYADGPGLNDANVAERRILARGTVEAITDELQIVIDGKPYGSGRLAYEEDCQAFGLE
ncbi:MAG: BirA family transcriptional regulator [Candidatus Sumerlaeota bacterium]|nr:BirA family transcriptional regulator [Candidatus Sumerlaeota bacterium]